jgi:hypothetical protein
MHTQAAAKVNPALRLVFPQEAAVAVVGIMEMRVK